MNKKERHEEARELMQSGVPKSERSRSSLGQLEMSLQAVGGLCPLPRCVRKQGHTGPCWPAG